MIVLSKQDVVSSSLRYVSHDVSKQVLVLTEDRHDHNSQGKERCVSEGEKVFVLCCWL